MNRKNQFALSIIIACTLAASSYQGTFADDLDDQLQDIQGQIDESHNSQANWQEIIDQVNVKLRAIQVDLDAANARLKDIQNQQAQINAQIKQTQEEIRKAQEHLLQHQKVLNQRVRSIYMHGQLNYLEVITGAKSFSDFANRLELLKRVIRSDYNLILEIQNQKAQIEAKEEQLEKDKARLDALAQEAQKAQSQIAAKKAEQQKVLDDAKDNKAAAAQMEQDLIAESKRVHNLIQERLRQQEAARQAASQSGGEVGFPPLSLQKGAGHFIGGEDGGGSPQFRTHIGDGGPLRNG